MKKCYLHALAACSAFAYAVTCAAEFQLHDADTVVFLGDSITEGGAYTTPVEDYVVTRFPRMRVRFVNSGVGKDTIQGGVAGAMSERLLRDVAPFQPSVVAMMFGMNDGRFQPYDSSNYDAYLQGYKKVIASLGKLAPNARLTIIRPSPYDDITRPVLWGNGYNDVLVRFGSGLAGIASDAHATLVDFNGPVADDLRRLSTVAPDDARLLFPDRVHPVPAGGLLLAEALLKAWGATPDVSALTIQAGQRPTWSASDTQVRNVSGGRSLSWESLDGVLPMPLPDDRLSKVVVAHTDFLESLSEQRLTVRGLTEPRYRLSIDGKQIADLDANELARGINLAAYATPMSAQAADVHMLTLAHNSIRATRWRRVQMLQATQHSRNLKPTLDALDRAEAQIVTLQRDAAIPVWHRFDLSPL